MAGEHNVVPAEVLDALQMAVELSAPDTFPERDPIAQTARLWAHGPYLSDDEPIDHFDRAHQTARVLLYRTSRFGQRASQLNRQTTRAQFTANL